MLHARCNIFHIKGETYSKSSSIEIPHFSCYMTHITSQMYKLSQIVFGKFVENWDFLCYNKISIRK